MIPKKNKGAALIVVIVVMAVMIILGTALINISLSNNKQVIYQQKSNQAYYMARSGADAIASYIIKNPNEVKSIINKTSSSPATGTIGTNSFRVQVINGASTGNVLIKSTGIVSGAPSVNASLTLIQITSKFSNAIVVSSDAPDLNGSTINGNIITNALASSMDISKKGTVNGRITYNATISLPPADSAKFPNTYDSSYILKDGDKIYARIDTLNNAVINNIKSSINISSNPNALAELHLYVNTNLNLTSVSPPPGVAVFIYYNGTGQAPGGNGKFDMKQCLFYLPNTSFDINGGGNGTYYGTIIAKDCTFPNSHGTFTLDPIVNSSDMVGGTPGYIRGTWGK